MILKALTDYYEILLKKNKVGKDGWSFAKVSYAITIDADGQVKNIISLLKSEQRGKKEVLVPVSKKVPMQQGRSRQVAPYFMCDNAKYLLGAWCPTGNIEIDEKNKKQAKEYFEASAEYHKNILKDSACVQSRSVLRFFETWNFEENKDKFNVQWERILESSGLIFRFYDTAGELLDESCIQEAWDKHYNADRNQKEARCLVTGNVMSIARLHPLLKGVIGAQSSGAALVSFNGNAFESYGKEQGDNAPISEYAANAYGKALNYLLSDAMHHRKIGDTTVVFWTETEENEDGYSRFVMELFGEAEESDDQKLVKIMDSVSKGESCVYGESELKPETKFYILGLSPNAARISIRFFYNGTFGEMVSNIREHCLRLMIESPDYEKKLYPSIPDILYETVNKKSNDKQAQPILVGTLMNSVLTNTRYPAALYSGLMLRIHAERSINRNRTAVLKAYIIKNYPGKKEVVDTMKLNSDTEYVPYVLGRLFAVLEDIQISAIEKETLKEQYFNAASSTPAVIFPQIIKLANSHLRVLARKNKGLQVVKEKELEELFNKIHDNFPARLSLEDQGIFMIGYYHQVQKRYEKNKKDEKQEV